jgi:predicted CXXCH cytochrome family protein
MIPSRFPFIVIALAVALAAAAWSFAQTDAPTPPAPSAGDFALTVAAPTTPIALDSCVTDQCHANVKDHKVVHGPTNVNACDACHTLSDATTHSFTFTREKAELCTFCHMLSEVADAPNIHQPLKEGDCLGCHDSHGGTDRSFLKARSAADLCKNCHEDMTANKKSVHGPVAAGACNVCHLPHASTFPRLLVQEGRSLCAGCHQELTQQMDAAPFLHEPVKDACTQCHNPHASDQPMMVRQPTAELCVSCHEDVGTAISSATYQHSAVTQDDACTNCHTPHGGDLATLMRDRPINLCMNCHNQSVTTPDGHVVPAMSELANHDLNLHGPVRDGTCGGCHNVHGSNVQRLLAKTYPATFYETFAVEKYALCFNCHDKQLVLKPSANGLTGFRNGDDNLHFLHVNKMKRGRSCRACHSTHASSNPIHIRESVPYGNWELPVAFAPTATGGSCSPGCHQPLSYDRENPVVADVQTADTAAPQQEPQP